MGDYCLEHERSLADLPQADGPSPNRPEVDALLAAVLASPERQAVGGT